MDAVDDEGEAWLKEAEVMSEVHVGTAPGIKSAVSVFPISLPTGEGDDEGLLQGRASSDDGGHDHGVARTDEHGDLVLPRRAKKQKTENAPVDAVVIHHHVTTRLPHVGLQIWRGALLLSDFILHMMCTSKVFNNVTALELGSGTGLAGLVMARVAPLVFLTDKGVDILENCSQNVTLNVSSFSKGKPTVRVRELDWERPWPPHLSDEGNCSSLDKIGPCRWTPDDIHDAATVSVLLAADVVYSEELTTAFFKLLTKLMPPSSDKVLYVAMEKRYNFSLTDLDVVAHGYKHFRSFFTSDCPYGAGCDCGSNEGEQGNKNVDRKDSPHGFFGKRIDVTEIPQYMRYYSRGDDLELWELRPCKHVGNIPDNVVMISLAESDKG